MLFLAEQSGDVSIGEFVIEDRKLPDWRLPVVRGRWGRIEGHAYAYLCECLAQIRLQPFISDEGLTEETRKALTFCRWNGLVVTGTCGDDECWHDTQTGTSHLGETCTTAYLIRLYDHLPRNTGNPLWGDLMERAIFNALFAAQSPDGRRIRYYTPFEAPRRFHEADTYCCPCNFRRILAESPSMVYYRQKDGAFVNLYTASAATLPLPSGASLKIEQETDYPNSGLYQPRPRTRFTGNLCPSLSQTEMGTGGRCLDRGRACTDPSRMGRVYSLFRTSGRMATGSPWNSPWSGA